MFGVSETWLCKSVPNDRVYIKGYRVLRNDRTNKRGGGVCFYIKSDLTFKRINTSHIYNEDQQVEELTTSVWDDLVYVLDSKTLFSYINGLIKVLAEEDYNARS